MKLRLLAISTAVGLLGAAGAANAVDLRFMCSSDGQECEIMTEMINEFLAAEKPGNTLILDAVPYKAILESLPVQLAAGEGPDMARVTDLGGLNRHYLDLTPYIDTAYWDENMGGFLDWYRAGPDDKGYYGLHAELTITGGYINKTLFDQAGVAVPGEDASWDDWAAVSREVASATDTQFPMAMDRSGHRIAGPAMSYGAKYFAEDGTPVIVDDAFKGYVEKFVEWNRDGTMAREVWAGQGGTSYQDAKQEFVNGQLVYYYSGSWQIGAFDSTIGDFFDWQVVGTPCGAGGCTGMPGGGGIVGFKYSQHPELIGAIMDYFMQEEVYAEFMNRTRGVPAHKAVAEKGLDYPGASKNAAAALNAWGAQVPKLSPIAFKYQGHPMNRAMFNITVNRVTQAIVGELTVDEAMMRIEGDVKEALEQSN